MLRSATFDDVRRYGRKGPASRNDVMRATERPWQDPRRAAELARIGTGGQVGAGVRMGIDGSVVTGVPLTITGCKLWMTMRDASSYTQAGTVTAIINKASGISWTEATNPPDYAATGINSSPSMHFNGSSHRILSTEAPVFACLTNAHAFTLFVVGSQDVADSNTIFFGVGSTVTTPNRTRVFGNTTTGNGRWLARYTNDAGSNNSQATTSDINTSPHIIEWFSPGTTLTILQEGISQGVNAVAHNPGTLTPTRSGLGCRPGSTPDLFLDGHIGEIILYDTELSSGDRNTVRAYLSSEWSI